MIDWSRVEKLRDEVGVNEFDEVVELFLEEVDGAIKQLKENPRPEGFGKVLHFLQGSALSLGFHAFSRLCQNGEASALNGKPETIDLEKIFSCYAASRHIFVSEHRDRLAGHPAPGQTSL